MERLVCVLIGYAFGLIQTGYIYGKMHNVDIRNYGSGNAGTTNALRTLGWKAGAVTLVGDAFKCVFAVLAVRLIFGHSCSDILPMLSMYAGMGAVLGHNYPFYLKFKGGKGIAATGGLILSTTNPWVVLICLVTFIGIVFITRYVSVASMTVCFLYMLCVFYLGHTGAYHVNVPYVYEMYVIAVLLFVSALYKHKANIGRLLNGTENKLSVGKSKK